MIERRIKEVSLYFVFTTLVIRANTFNNTFREAYTISFFKVKPLSEQSREDLSEQSCVPENCREIKRIMQAP
jgi:hypothetical protein